MAFAPICKLHQVGRGQSAFAITAEKRAVVLLWPGDGELKAFQGICPHQGVPLDAALWDGETLMCQAHSWIFDGHTGQARPPQFCSLAQYALRIEGNDVLVDVTETI